MHPALHPSLVSIATQSIVLAHGSQVHPPNAKNLVSFGLQCWAHDLVIMIFLLFEGFLRLLITFSIQQIFFHAMMISHICLMAGIRCTCASTGLVQLTAFRTDKLQKIDRHYIFRQSASQVSHSHSQHAFSFVP